ncbi:MAG: hypothetical protein KF878_05045 [Planctomycetes bacterium]|nr:hypothetical protein [Planctomycetota bacterium]
MSAPLVLPLRRGRLLALLALALLFVAAGACFAWRVGPPALDFTRNTLRDEALRAIGLGAVGFFGLCAAAIARLLVRGGPGLVIDDEGLIDGTSGAAPGRVRWDEVAAVRVVRVPGGQPGLVGLELVDVERFLDRLSLLQRWLARSYVAAGDPPVGLRAASVGLEADALAALIEAERARRAPPAA